MVSVCLPRQNVLIVVLTVLVLAPATLWAQSAVTGQVRDNTGAVLPGVSVEASSPALIEGLRSGVTDGNGQYSIVNLRPGAYTVTFKLTGFTTIVRSNLELPANFTATVDVSMSLGSLEESVTVSGETPIVDVSQAQRTQVFNRDVLDAVPTTNSLWSIGNLAAGVTMQAPDVGGSSNVQDRELAAHGANSTHTAYKVDGMMVSTMIGDGRAPNYFTELSNDEVSIQTSGGLAENASGGLTINMIPRDGGNVFHGQASLSGSSGAWQGDNFSQRLKDVGIRAVDATEGVWDYGATAGGPIVQNRLWYNFTSRYWGNKTLQGDTYFDDGSQFVLDNYVWSVVPRITLQANPSNKFSLHFDRQARFRGPKLEAKYPAIVNGFGVDPETATTWKAPRRPYYSYQAKWTSTIGTRILVEAGAGYIAQLNEGRAQPGVEAARGTAEWYSQVRKTDPDLSITWNGAAVSWPYPIRKVASASMAYVTGSHNIKFGLQDTWGYTERNNFSNGDISQIQYRNGVPNSVTVGNYPVTAVENLNYELALYAQDQWTYNRVTVSGGLRLEWIDASVPEQTAGFGRFVGERHFAAVKNVPHWSDVSPRFAVTYNLFGDAKTAVKFSAGRYLLPLATSLATRLNPMAVATTSIPWNDRDLAGRTLGTNGDGIAQDSEIDLTRLPANFGQRRLETLDPDMRRESNIETTLGVQHQLFRSVSVSASWFRRTYQNLMVVTNLERSADDFVPVKVVSPYNGEIITVYNLKSAAEDSLVNNLISSSDEREQIYNGLEFAANWRMPNGGTLFGSVTTQRMTTNDCADIDDTNLLRFCDRGNIEAPYKAVPFITDFKFAGSYRLPAGISASFSFISNKDKGTFLNNGRGLNVNWLLSRTTRYTEAGCAGRPCTPGALVIPDLVVSSLTVPLAPSGTERFLPRLNQLDLTVKKTFRLGRLTYDARLDVFNALNVDTWLNERSQNYDTPTYGLPGNSDGFLAPPGIIVGRLPRLALQMKW
jgi:hypothetical protein